MSAEAEGRYRRPAGRSGPARDPERDRRILDAALSLLAEGGYPALSMTQVAAKAGVGKPTVYRRWASSAQLAAEAFHHGGLLSGPEVRVHGPGRLRRELIDTVTATSHCTWAGSPSLMLAMREMARTHPELGEALGARQTDTLREAIEQVYRTAERRGDTVPADDGCRRTRVDAAIALIVHGRRDDEDAVTDLVDHLLL